MAEQLSAEARPTISMRAVRYSENHFGVEITIAGLTSEVQAEAALHHAQERLCGQEIKTQ